MEVRLKFGRYEGEVRDVAAHIALELIADGRAEDPRMDGLKIFASGGIVPGVVAIVGESVQDFVIPKAVAEKIEAVMAPKKVRR